MEKYLLCLTLVLSLCLGGSALAVNWVGNGSLADPNNNLWDVDGNWSTGIVPTAGISVFLDRNTDLQPLVDSGITASCGIMRVGGTAGGGTTNTLKITGGSLTVNNGTRDDDIILGQGAGSTATIYISGGNLTCRAIWVGNNPGVALVSMTGGTLACTGGAGQKLFVDRFNKTSGTILLYGGVIDQTGGIYMGSGGSIDITEGTLLFSTNVSGAINNYVNSGQITAYGGASTVLVDYDDPTYPGKTWVRAELYPKAWAADPADGAFVEDLNQDVSWEPGYGAVSHDVYFGITDPPASIQNQTETSYDPGLFELGQTYYWRIDEYDGVTTHTGDVWSFTVLSAKQARNPNPANGETGVDWDDPLLSWTSGDGAVSHDVYFAKSGDPLTAVSLGQSDPNYAAGTLVKGVEYSWRVDENDGVTTTQGVVWSFTVVAGAGGTNWTNGDPTNELWSSELNWSEGFPGNNSNVWIDVDPNVLIDDTVAAVAKLVRMSVANTGDPNLPGLRMTGGSLTTYDHFIMGQNTGSTPVFEMSGGIFTGTNIWLGNNPGKSVLNMTGGTINLSGTLWVDRFSRTTARLYLNGGVISANALSIGTAATADGIIDIAGGTLIINGDKAGLVNGYIDDGLITAYNVVDPGGTGILVVDYGNVNPGKTTVVACPSARQADFNGDCNVDLTDLRFMASEWLFQTPSEVSWEFDMSTDPVGPGIYDLELRDTVNTNYNMTDVPGMMHVTGPLLLDEKVPSSGKWDADLHYIARCETEDALKLWVTMDTSASPGMKAYVGVSIYNVAATNTQTVEIWTGTPPHVTPYTPVQVTGFAPDALIDITVSYDYDTDMLSWTATDGALSDSGAGVPYYAFNDGNGGNFTIHGEDGSTGYIDYMSRVIYGSDWYSVYDLQPDGSVNLKDFAALASELFE